MRAVANPPASRFWRWWISELKSFAPKLRSRKAPVRAPVVVRLSADKVDIVNSALRNKKLLATLKRESAEFAGAVARVSRQFPSKVVAISLASELCLARHSEIPAHALDDAENILLLDLEANSPLRNNDVYIAIIDRPRESGQASVNVASLVVKRSDVDPVMRDLERCGLQISHVDAFDEKTGEALPAQFIIDKHRAPKRQQTPKRSALALAAITMAFTAVYVWFDRQEAEIARISAIADETQKQATKLRSDRDAVERRRVQAEEVEGLRDVGRARLAAINELSRLLPETTWLTDLEIDDQDVLISGYSLAAARLVALIDSSELFSDAQLTAPVVFEAAEGKDRFSIRFQLALARSRNTQAIKDPPIPVESQDLVESGIP